MKTKIVWLSILLSTIMIVSMFSAISLISYAQEDEEEEDIWDFEGYMRVTSDENRFLVLGPTERADMGLNESVGGYTRPNLYFGLLGLDTDDDEGTDIYYGFYGNNFIDTSHLNYTTAQINLYKITVNARWRLRIPDGSLAKWEVFYYPDPNYSTYASVLDFNTPIYYVNLTKYTGVNLQYRIDYGLNYTLGNFTTFGDDNPLYPDMPSFPGYNVSIPLFTSSNLIEELLETSFFSNTIGFLMVVTITFLIFNKFKKWKKKKPNSS
ncbi:MAG: hypothetical protein ACFFDS_09100 [Candidatus Thorarchaeota archaeon]